MKKKHVWLAAVCLVAGVYFIFAGSLQSWWFFLLAAAALGGYVLIDRKLLGCPKCRAFINLDRLFYAFGHEFHCHKCGEKIEIQ